MPTKAKQEIEEKIATPGGRYHYANGKRKTSVARVRLYKGKGIITVNNRPAEEYFTIKSLMGLIKTPLKLTGHNGKFDITAVISGGGISSQAQALRHGIAKGLVVMDAELKPVLKKEGLLTRDSRKKERKKPGLKKARKAPQFSKR